MTDPVIVLGVTGLDRETQVVRALMQRGSGFRVHRRVCDVIELSSFGGAASVDVVGVSPRFPRLTLDLVQSLVRSGSPVIAIVDRGDDGAERVARQWGLSVAVVDNEGDCAAALREAISRQAVGAGPEQPVGSGRLIAVCGPTGSTGRSTVAMNVAAELGGRRLLIDADLRAPSIAFQMGVPDDPSGLIAACTQAERGLLDVPRLRFSCAEPLPGLLVCSGVGHPGRAREVRAGGFDGVLRTSRSAADTTVVDCGPTTVPGATFAVHEALLAGADRILVIGSATAVGIRRLADWLREVDPARDRTTMVWNGLRSGRDSALGRNPLRRLRAGVGVGASAGADAVIGLPWDPVASVAMDRRPGPLCEVAPRSRLREAIAALSAA
jgi:MinD-like ATPase involved in chromosome partitioning or flagellar assembly